MHVLPHDYNLTKLRSIKPRLRYEDNEPFAQWQLAACQKLMELVGLPLEPCSDMLNIEFTKDHGVFIEIRFTFQSEPGYTVPCHLWVPSGQKMPLPVVICLQGHSTGMHISLGRAKYSDDEETIKGGDRDFAVRAVSEGYCALAIDQRCFGECGGTPDGPDCNNSSLTAMLIGRTTVGERTWDVMKAIDVLGKHFPQTDSSKIVCMGNSGGGTTALFASCLDTRISYSMPSSYFCSFDDSIAAMRHCVCNYVPSIRLWFDMGDMAGLIAPRPLVIVSGREDPIFPHNGVQAAYDIAKGLYAAAGVPKNIELVTGDGGHRFYADIAWPVMKGFIDADS